MRTVEQVLEIVKEFNYPTQTIDCDPDERENCYCVEIVVPFVEAFSVASDIAKKAKFEVSIEMHPDEDKKSYWIDISPVISTSDY